MKTLHALILSLALPVASVSAQGILYYAATDGSVPCVNVANGTNATQSTVLTSALFPQGANPGAGRHIAYDPETGLMWYSSTDNRIYSANVFTSSAGPTITNVPGAVIGAARHVFVDYKRRTLWACITDGSVKIYSLATQAEVGTVPAGFFTDGNVGGSRHFASDKRNGMMWYAATDGSFREMDPSSNTHTGRQISFAQQVGADPGAFRHFVIDPLRDLLIYSVTDGSCASVNLTTLTKANFTIPSNVFIGANPGAGRIITYDLLPVNAAPVRIAGNNLQLTWNGLDARYAYTIEYRDSLATGAWAPVPPVNQWPSTNPVPVSLPISGPGRFYRVNMTLR